MDIVSPSRFATALKGTGKVFPESPSVASLLLMRMPPLFVEIMSYPRASHHPKGYWEKPCFSVRLRSGLEWRMPPFRVEMKVVSPSRFATALKGTGKGFPESPSVAALLLMLTPLPYLLRLCRTPRASHHPEGYWEKPCFSVR